MTVYYFKFRGKPTGKIFIYTASNKKEIEKELKYKLNHGYKCTPIWKGMENGSMIYGGKSKNERFISNRRKK